MIEFYGVLILSVFKSFGKRRRIYKGVWERS